MVIKNKEGTRKNPPRQPSKASAAPSPTPHKQKGKAVATSSGPDIEEDGERTTAPWPRPDDTLIIDDRVPTTPSITATELQRMTCYASRKYGDPWARFNSVCYNGLMHVDIAPTKFLCIRTLTKMGIAKDVDAMLSRMGLSTLARTTYPLYPEFVRQFLASAELKFADPKHPTASRATLSYLCRGILYEISIPELCDLYGFDSSKEECKFPGVFLGELWDLIGTQGRYSREAKLSLIRNPVIRVVAKILGHTLFAKEETGSLRDDELLLLHYGFPSFIDSIYVDDQPSCELDTNLGAIFAAMLVQKKFRGLKSASSKKEFVGSLLTPIFEFHELDLSSTRCVDKLEFVDEKYLKSSGSLKTNFQYQFIDRAGVTQRCQLPLPQLTALTSVQNVEFLLDPQHLLPPPSVPAVTRRRGASSHAGTSQPHLEDDRVPDPFAQPRPQSHATMEPLLPAYSGEYDLSLLPDDATDTARLAWLVESQRKQQSMLTKIWGALAKLSCPRQPSCFRPSTTETGGRDAATSAGPTVAGHRTTDEDDAAGVPRPPRRRRLLRESPSDSSESH